MLSESNSIVNVPGDRNMLDFMYNNYTGDFKYADFAPLFKAEAFDPEVWAELFSDAGAQFVLFFPYNSNVIDFYY